MAKKNDPINFLGILLAAWLFTGGNLGGCAFSPFVEAAPFPADKLSVLILEETDDRGTYTPGQREAMLSTAGVREYIKAKGGEPLTVLDDDAPVDKAPPWIQAARKAAQPTTLPWIIVATHNGGMNKPLPTTAEETLAALKKIGGP